MGFHWKHFGVHNKTWGQSMPLMEYDVDGYRGIWLPQSQKDEQYSRDHRLHHRGDAPTKGWDWHTRKPTGHTVSSRHPNLMFVVFCNRLGFLHSIAGDEIWCCCKILSTSVSGGVQYYSEISLRTWKQLADNILGISSTTSLKLVSVTAFQPVGEIGGSPSEATFTPVLCSHCCFCA